MTRKLSISIYAGAFVISLAIFLLGIYIGTLMDTSNLESISDEVSSISDRLSAVQVLMLAGGNESFCPLYESELGTLDSDIETIGHKLSFLEDERNVHDAELKRKYFVLEAESYLLSMKVKSLCNDSSALLIHFYSNKNCANCREQGTEVLQARDTLASQGVNVKLFSFDGELDSPVAEAFEAQYNITEYPSIVVNEQVYSGFKDSGQLESIIRDAQ